MKTLTMIAAIGMIALTNPMHASAANGGSVKIKKGGTVKTNQTSQTNGGRIKTQQSGWVKQYR